MMTRFGLSQLQAEAILNMQLRQLTALEREKIEDEYKDLLKRIAYLEDLLADPLKILGVIKDELKYLKDKFGDERRTRIIPVEADEIGEEDMIPEEETIITITRDGYIKRVPIDTYRAQRRGGKGKIGATAKEEDKLAHLFVATTHHYILFFTDRGRVYRLKAYEIPQTTRQAMGTAIINLIHIEPGDKITADRRRHGDGQGRLPGHGHGAGRGQEDRPRGVPQPALQRPACFDIEEGDALQVGRDLQRQRRGGPGHPQRHVDPVPREGPPQRRPRIGRRARDQALRRRPRRRNDPRPTPTASCWSRPKAATASAPPLDHYRKQTRGGKGIKTMNLSEKTGKIVETAVVDDTDKIVIITTGGIMLKIRVKEIRSMRPLAPRASG